MQKNLKALLSLVIACSMNLKGAENTPAAARQDPLPFKLMEFPLELQKEILSRVESVAVIKQLQTSNKYLKALIDSMIQSRQLNPQVLWGLTKVEPLVLEAGDNLHTVNLSADKTIVATGDWKGIIKFWDAHTGQLLRTIATGQYSIHMVMSRDKKIVINAGLLSGTLTVYNTLTGEKLDSLAPPNIPFQAGPSPVSALLLSQDNALAVVSNSNVLTTWNLRTQAKTTEIFEKSVTGTQLPKIYSLAANPDATTILLGMTDGSTRVRGSGVPPGILFGLNDSPVTALALSPDGMTALVGHDNGKVDLWNVPSAAQKMSLEGHLKPLFSVALSPDKKMALTASTDGMAKIWDLTSGKSGKVIGVIVHTPAILSCALSDDKRMIVTAARSQAKIWNLDRKLPGKSHE